MQAHDSEPVLTNADWVMEPCMLCLLLKREAAVTADSCCNICKHGLTCAVPAARWYFQQLVMAVSYCHSMGIVNRDIKVRGMADADAVRAACVQHRSHSARQQLL